MSAPNDLLLKTTDLQRVGVGIPGAGEHYRVQHLHFGIRGAQSFFQRQHEANVLHHTFFLVLKINGIGQGSAGLWMEVESFLLYPDPVGIV